MGVGAGVSGGSKDTSNHTVSNSTTNGTGTAGSLNVGGTFYDPAVTGYNSGVLGTIGGLANSYLGPATNANATAGNYLNGQGNTLAGNQATANGAYTGAATYQPQQLTLDNPAWAPQTSAGKFTDADVNSYMSPYLQNVAGTTLNNLGRANDIALNNQNAQAAAGGYFGGSRSGVLNAETNKNFGDTAATAMSNLFNTGYTNAQGQINADQNRALTADTGNADRNLSAQQINKTAEYNTQLANANLGLQGQQLNIAGANGLSGANSSILSGLQGLSAGGLNYGGLASGAGKGLPVNSNTGSLNLGNTANNNNTAGVSNSNGGESGVSGNVQV